MSPDPRVFGIAFVVALTATWGVARVARRKGLLDAPEERRTHTVPTPRLGGIGILLGIAAGWAAMHVLPEWSRPEWHLYDAPAAWDFELPIAVGAVAFFLVGLLDDLRRGRRGLSAGWKLLLQLAAGAIPVLLGMHWWGETYEKWSGAFGLPSRDAPFDRWPAVRLGDAAPWMSVLWFVAVVNVVNFMDGIDAIAASIVLPIFVFGTIWGFHATYHVPWVAAAATLGFLVWNRPPARVFMGDGGSHLLGYLVAVLTCRPAAPPVLSGWFEIPGFGASPWPLVAAPLVPSIVDVGEALIHKARHGIPMSLAHNDHLYQRLVKAGVPTGLVALRYGLLSVAAILCAGPLAHAIGVLSASAVGAAVLGLHLWDGVRRTRGVPRLAKP